MDDYLIWSNKRRMWRGAGETGYTRRIARAGIYSRAEAMRICLDAMPRRRGAAPLTEIPVLLADMEEMLRVAAPAIPISIRSRWKTSHDAKCPRSPPRVAGGFGRNPYRQAG